MIIKKEDEILEVVEKYPKTEIIFSKYDEITGKCVLCNHLFETIEEFAFLYNIEIKKLIDDLNRTVTVC